MKIDGWVSTRSFHPVFFIGRVFSRDSSGTRKKAVFAIAARNRFRRRGRRLDRAMRDGERVRHSRRRTPASADRRVEPGIEPRTRRGRTDFSSTHHRNPPRDDVFFANTRRSSRRPARLVSRATSAIRRDTTTHAIACTERRSVSFVNVLTKQRRATVAGGVLQRSHAGGSVTGGGAHHGGAAERRARGPGPRRRARRAAERGPRRDRRAHAAGALRAAAAGEPRVPRRELGGGMLAGGGAMDAEREGDGGRARTPGGTAAGT